MFKGITWAAVALALGPALLAALSTLAGSWLTNHFQRENKKLELDRQAELRARELLFDAYQKRLEEYGKDAQQMTSALGKLAGNLSAEEDEEERQVVWEALIQIIQFTLDPLMIWARDLEVELQAVGLLGGYEAHVRRIKKALATDFSKVSLADKDTVLPEFMMVFSSLTAIRDALSTKRCNDLFSKYLAE